MSKYILGKLAAAFLFMLIVPVVIIAYPQDTSTITSAFLGGVLKLWFIVCSMLTAGLLMDKIDSIEDKQLGEDRYATKESSKERYG